MSIMHGESRGKSSKRLFQEALSTVSNYSKMGVHKITSGNEKWHVKVAILAACESKEDLNVDFCK